MEPLPEAKRRRYASLHRKRSRQKHGLFLAEGLKLLGEALQAGHHPEAVVCREDVPPPELPPTVPAYAAKEAIFRQLSGQVNPEGVVSVLRLPELATSDAWLRPAFVLWELRDPGNLGSLLRTADWFGFRAAYVTPGTVDAFNPKVVRAAMGALFRVPVIPLQHPLPALREVAGDVLAADLQAEPLQPAHATGHSLLLVGSESHGLPASVRSLPGLQRVSIPGRGGAESLNAAVAGGILAFAWELGRPDA